MKRSFEELDRLSFSPGQKEALFHRLTQPPKGAERPHLPYRGLVALVAAASMLMGAAGAVSLAGISPEFREMFGIRTQEDEAQLGSLSLDMTFRDKKGSGAAITVREIVRDQERLFLLADFAAPEGTVLPRPEPHVFGYWLDGDHEVGKKCLNWTLFQDKDCTQRVNVQGLGFSSQALEDPDPTDNVVPLLIYVDADRGFPEGSNYLQLSNIFYLDTSRGGETAHAVKGLDIELVVPISVPSPTYSFSGRCPVKLGDQTMAVAENLVLSPLSISMDLILADGDAYDRMIEEQGGIPAYVLLYDGTRIPLQFNKAYGLLDWYYTQDGELGKAGEMFFRSDHIYFTPEWPIDLAQIKDIVFVGDNDPEKIASPGGIVHFLFQPMRFTNDIYWEEVNGGGYGS